MPDGAEEIKIIFSGPHIRHYAVVSFFIVYVILIVILAFFMNPFGFFRWSKTSFSDFFIISMIVGLMTLGVWSLQYVIGKKGGLYDSKSIQLIISNSKITSIITESGKRHVRVVFAENIKKMRYVRDLGGTGHKIKIWPKDYDILAKNGFEFGKGVLEYYKKHKTPVILFPPALSRKERKRLKEAIEEFKKRNGIE